jgi:hypothetical protein
MHQKRTNKMSISLDNISRNVSSTTVPLPD